MTSTLCSIRSVLLGCLVVIGRCARMNERFGNFQDNMHQRFGAGVRPSQSRLDSVLSDPAPDEATAARGWDAQTLNYPHGGAIAGPTYNLNYEDRPRWLARDELYAAAQPGILLLDVALMPFYAII